MFSYKGSASFKIYVCSRNLYERYFIVMLASVILMWKAVSFFIDNLTFFIPHVKIHVLVYLVNFGGFNLSQLSWRFCHTHDVVPCNSGVTNDPTNVPYLINTQYVLLCDKCPFKKWCKEKKLKKKLNTKKVAFISSPPTNK